MRLAILLLITVLCVPAAMAQTAPPDAYPAPPPGYGNQPPPPPPPTGYGHQPAPPPPGYYAARPLEPYRRLLELNQRTPYDPFRRGACGVGDYEYGQHRTLTPVMGRHRRALAQRPPLVGRGGRSAPLAPGSAPPSGSGGLP